MCSLDFRMVQHWGQGLSVAMLKSLETNTYNCALTQFKNYGK